MLKEDTTRCHNRGLEIGDYGAALSMATESRYTPNRQQTQVEVVIEDILLVRHARLEGYSGSI
jgi:hypothetical protein